MVVKSAPKNKQQKMKRRFIFRTVTLSIILLAVIYALIMNLTKDDGAVKKGDEAPDFELTQINHNHAEDHIQLSDLEGKGVVLNFWASYCKPCESQMLFMEALYPDYQDDIEIVAVNLDNSELVIQQFINKYNFSFAVMHDKRSEIMDMYQVSPMPTTFFINPEGEVVEEVVGSIVYQDLERYFNAIAPKEGK